MRFCLGFFFFFCPRGLVVERNLGKVEAVSSILTAGATRLLAWQSYFNVRFFVRLFKEKSKKEQEESKKKQQEKIKMGRKKQKNKLKGF